MDSQSVHCDDNRSLNDIDSNKKVENIKQHVMVDKNGFLIAAMETIACAHDDRGAYPQARCLKELCCGIKVILADANHRGEMIEMIKKTFRYILEAEIK